MPKLGLGWRLLDWLVGLAVGWYGPKIGVAVIWWAGGWAIAVTLINTILGWCAWRNSPTRVASDAVADAVESIEDPEYLRQTVGEISKAETRGKLTSRHLWRYFSRTLLLHHVPQVAEAGIIGFIVGLVFMAAGR